MRIHIPFKTGGILCSSWFLGFKDGSDLGSDYKEKTEVEGRPFRNIRRGELRRFAGSRERPLLGPRFDRCPHALRSRLADDVIRTEDKLLERAARWRVSDQLIVAGFHRSGTSLVCQLLDRAGLFLGYELLGTNPLNLYGRGLGFDEVPTSEVFDPTVTDRRSGQATDIGQGVDRADRRNLASAGTDRQTNRTNDEEVTVV